MIRVPDRQNRRAQVACGEGELGSCFVMGGILCWPSRPVLNRLRQVRGLDLIGGHQVCDRPAHFEGSSNAPAYSRAVLRQVAQECALSVILLAFRRSE